MAPGTLLGIPQMPKLLTKASGVRDQRPAHHDTRRMRPWPMASPPGPSRSGRSSPTTGVSPSR
jgi:hypothetical protein